jgi:hypothetical protein
VIELTELKKNPLVVKSGGINGKTYYEAQVRRQNFENSQLGAYNNLKVNHSYLTPQWSFSGHATISGKENLSFPQIVQPKTGTNRCFLYNHHRSTIHSSLRWQQRMGLLHT